MIIPQFDSQEEQDEYYEMRAALAEARAQAAIDRLEDNDNDYDPHDSDVAADLWQRALDKRCEH